MAISNSTPIYTTLTDVTWSGCGASQSSTTGLSRFH